MMNRLITGILLTLMIGAAIVVYDLKHRVETASVHVAGLERDIEREREAIALLKAEWSHLTQPTRLQELIERYGTVFELENIEATQISTIADIPLKPIDLPPNSNAPLGGYAGGPDNQVQ